MQLYKNSDDEYMTIDEDIKRYSDIMDLIRKNHTDIGIKNIDLTILTIIKLDSICQSEWEGKLSNNMNFYVRYRNCNFKFFIYEGDNSINSEFDSPIIDLYCEDLKSPFFITEEKMLELCGLKFDSNYKKLKLNF